MTTLISRKTRNVQFIRLYALFLIVILCSYAGFEVRQYDKTEKVPFSIEKDNEKVLGHVSQMLLSLKTFIFLDSEDPK